MECFILAMKSLLYILLLCSLFTNTSFADNKKLLLIANPSIDLSLLSKKQIRKLFLGYSVEINGQYLSPLLNQSSPLVHEVFLQKVVFLSKRKYHHILKRKIFQTGFPQPKTFKNVVDLISDIKKKSNALSYIWSDSLNIDKNNNTIVLWQGDV